MPYPIPNTLSVPVSCNKIIEITDSEQLQLLPNEVKNAEKTLIMGEGSNLLFVDDFDGLIIKNSLSDPPIVKIHQSEVWITLSGGMNWHSAVEYCVEQGFWGIENLSLIPGLVGSAPVQNIGAYGVELKDCSPVVQGIFLDSGNGKSFDDQECGFSYRDSLFKRELRDQFLIVSVTLKLSLIPKPCLDYGGISNDFIKQNPTLKNIAQRICDLRHSKLPSPEQTPNAGSFFKNPIVSSETFQALQQQYSNIVGFPTDSGIKIPAAWLIQTCGLKGWKHPNGAEISEKHALILINPKKCSGKAVLKLCQDVQQIVQKTFNIFLEPEVRIIGNTYSAENLK